MSIGGFHTHAPQNKDFLGPRYSTPISGVATTSWPRCNDSTPPITIPDVNKRTFHRVGRLTCQNHVFDVTRERVKEVGGRRAVTGHGQIHLAGQNLAGVGEVARVIEIADAREKDRRPKSVPMFDQIPERIRAVFGEPSRM